MNNKEVILLGAGASKSEGAPLQNELFKEFFEYYKKNSEGQELKIQKNQERLIIEFFKEFWGVDIFSDINQEIQFPTFEECLGMLDLAYLRGECFKKFDKKKINDIRNAIVFLIAKILDEKLRGFVSNHKSLVYRLAREKRLKDTTFISLNYDIIIDNVLMDLYLDVKYHLDYGIEFINYRNKTTQNLIEHNNSILLLKVHGSLNWLYCPTCNQIKITPKRKGAIQAFYKSKKCSYCKTPMEPIIIPPTFYKELTNPYFDI
ncbi:MAG: SIR2 family protein [Candidatus Helarchaeota archaeon]